MKKKLLLTLVLSLVLTGCSGGIKTNVEFTDNYGDSYPIKTDKTLTVWCEFPSNALKGATNLNDLPLAQQLEKETGIHVEYIHPTDPTSNEEFNLMLASGELPDIIMSRWCQFSGGANKAVDDGYILPLNEIVEKYSPDFSAALDKYDARRFFSTDDGELFFYPGIWDYDAVNVSGFMLRKDWLDELGLEVPETMDEWEHVLREFKDKKGATAPFTSTFQQFYEGGFPGAYGIILGYYVDNGEIKTGYAEPQYKDLLETLIRWRDEGLFDKNFSTVDTATLTTNMLTGKSGATYGGQGAVMGGILGAATEKGFDLVAAPFPTLVKGEQNVLAKKNAQAYSQMGAAITTQCDDVELAARWLNYGYTNAGRLTYTFGIEGESYEMVDGKPVYTDYVMHNPDGIGVKNMLDRYTRSATTSGPFIKAYAYLQQYAQLPQQKQALELWSDIDADPAEIPPLYFTDEEQTVVSELHDALITYENEMFYKFINKSEPLENFDKYLETLEKLGNSQLLEIYNAAYQRYLKR